MGGHRHTRLIVTNLPRRVAGSLRTRLGVLVTTVREHPKSAAAAVVAFVVRWSLRIGLPLAGVAGTLTLFPYRAAAGGAHFLVQGSIVTRPGLSADTSFGSWVFPHVDGLPVGVHVSPVNVDLVRIASAASPNPQQYAERLRLDLADQLPAISVWIIGEVLIGVLVGLGAAAAVNLAIRQLRGLPRRDRELRHRLRQLAAAGAVVAVLAVVGVVTYEPHWARQSRSTGTLAALQLLPNQLRSYYNQNAKAVDVLSAVAAIQAGLQQHLEEADLPTAAFNIMFISDMHLASTYPLVAQYAKNFDVKLIINTGDEAEFGTRPEMTRTYLDQLRAVTRIAPMIWLAGNHDSPDTVETMRSVPGVTILGTKSADGSGGYQVSAQQMIAYGLTIAAVPDPRVYGGGGEFGAADNTTVNALEHRAVDAALSGVSPQQRFDIFATHEPVAVDEIVKDLPGQIRQTNAGHVHAQNSDKDIQNGGPITLVEGSTGAGGLDNLARRSPVPPIEFSVESVAADCQFTKITRFQITSTPPGGAATSPTSGTLPQVTASTRYLKPQHLPETRLCATSLGLSQPAGP
jgi:predicted MPP superfamily phosphohydrolase